MLTIIYNTHGYHLVNITLGSIIASFNTEQEAQQLKAKILQ